MSVTIFLLKTPSWSGSIRVKIADEIITESAPASIPLRNGSRDSPSAVMSLSFATPWSVLTVTSPNPGKCFREVTIPASCIPWVNSTTDLLTAVASLPKLRLRFPIGALLSCLSLGTTSATGARS